MKKYLISSAIFASSILSAAADGTLPEKLQLFGEGATLMMTGIDTKDRADLSDAAEIFSSLKCMEMEEYDVTERKAGDLGPAKVFFSDTFCNREKRELFANVDMDELDFINDYSAVEMDDLDGLRETEILPDLLLIPKAISAGGEVSFTILGSEEMAVGIAASAPSALRYQLLYGGRPIAINTDETGHFSSAIWEMGPEEEPFTLKITNPTKKEVSFTIALEG